MSKEKNKNTAHIRHLSYQIVAQLPEDQAEAILVLDYAKHLLLREDWPVNPPIEMKLVKKSD